MELKPGYKQTEVGVIPLDWEVKELGTFTDCTSGGTPSTLISSYWGGKIPWMSSGELHLKRVKNVEGRITDLGLNNSSTKIIPKNCVLIGLAGQGKTRGTVAINFIELCTNQSVAAIFPRSSFDSEYLFHNLDARYDELRDLSSGDGGRGGLNLTILKGLQIPFPSIEEQTAIATVLSDMDALLDSLDRLIAKKRDIQQAAMQELLTGKTRLPGFEGEWEVKRLGDVATLKARIGWQGLTTAEYLSSGEHYLVTGTEFDGGYIDWSKCCFVDDKRYRMDRYIQLKVRDVLVTKDGTIGKVALVSKLPGSATLNSGVFVIRPINDAFSPEFFYYILCSSFFSDFLGQLAAGSTINHLYQKDFVNFSFSAPPSLSEQTAIAKVLSDMDAEIEALEERRTKTQNIKQGMMQELLTGKTRLIAQKASHD